MPTKADRSLGRKRLTRRLEGQRFGRLVVLRYGGQHRTAGAQFKNLWVCRCDCPAQTVVTIRQDKLENGRTRSCGCLRPTKAPPEQRLTEAHLVMPFRDLLRQSMDQKALPYELLKQRWLGEPSPIAATMNLPTRTAKGFETIMRRDAPRVPDEDETKFLAQCLNLRGLDKDRFLDSARKAREAIAAARAQQSLLSEGGQT